jgi:hypothetical protein
MDLETERLQLKWGKEILATEVRCQHAALAKLNVEKAPETTVRDGAIPPVTPEQKSGPTVDEAGHKNPKDAHPVMIRAMAAHRIHELAAIVSMLKPEAKLAWLDDHCVIHEGVCLLRLGSDCVSR